MKVALIVTIVFRRRGGSHHPAGMSLGARSHAAGDVCAAGVVDARLWLAHALYRRGWEHGRALRRHHRRHRCTWCDGYPCLVHAKSDAETIAVGPALASSNVTLLKPALTAMANAMQVGEHLLERL